jgi:hypothetical protein
MTGVNQLPHVKPTARNPYAPPSSAVADIDGMTSEARHRSERMPGVVIAALLLFGAGFAVGVVRVILMNLGRGPGHVIFGIAFVTVVGSLWIYGLYSRRNWVRWLTIVWTGIGTLVTLWATPQISDPRQVPMNSIQIVATSATIVLLCLPSAGRWYGRRNAH